MITKHRAALVVVVVTYNSADVISGLLDSLSAGLAGIEDIEVVVADNNSTDASVAISSSHPARPRVLRLDRNGGYAAGINAAAGVADPDADLLILNPDIRLDPGSVRLLRQRLREAKVGVAVPQIRTEQWEIARSLRREPSMLSAWADALLGGTLATRLGTGEIIGDPGLYARGGNVDWATGAALLISAKARRAVGPWDESFFLYSEEVDYLRRVRESGFTIAYVPEAGAMHIGGDHKVNPRLYALLTANRIRYYQRHHGPLATALFRLGVGLGEALRAARGPGHRTALRETFFPAASPDVRRAR